MVSIFIVFNNLAVFQQTVHKSGVIYKSPAGH